MQLIINAYLSKKNQNFVITYSIRLADILHILISAVAICLKA